MPKFNVQNHFLQLLTFNREGVHLNAQLSDDRKRYSVERIVGGWLHGPLGVTSMITVETVLYPYRTASTVLMLVTPGGPLLAMGLTSENGQCSRPIGLL